MLDLIKDIFAGFGLRDAVDIGIVSVLIYFVLKLIKGTRAAYMLSGLFVIIVAYWLSNLWDLYTLHTILTYFLSSLLLIIIVIFQNDIRRALVQVGRYPFFQTIETPEETRLLEEIIRTVQSLANKKIGALIVFEREADLEGHVEKGVRLDARISKELITSIFLPVSPLHDGAIIIKNGKITNAACFLPLTLNPGTSLELGSRHRAALGLSEETDAVIVVVSEERGSISVAINGSLTSDLDAAALRRILLNIFKPPESKLKKLWKRFAHAG